MRRKISEIETEIINSFAEASSFLGYSEVHSKIIAALLVSGKDISLETLAKRTSYSTSMISLSLDLLEVLGIIKKLKKQGDRKLYVELQGDLLPTLKTAVILKIQKGIIDGRKNFEEYRKEIAEIKNSDKKNLLKTLGRLENELSRIERYINRLAEVEVPE